MSLFLCCLFFFFFCLFGLSRYTSTLFLGCGGKGWECEYTQCTSMYVCLPSGAGYCALFKLKWRIKKTKEEIIWSWIIISLEKHYITALWLMCLSCMDTTRRDAKNRQYIVYFVANIHSNSWSVVWLLLIVNLLLCYRHYGTKCREREIFARGCNVVQLPR